ncbi:Uncharacterized protein OS=Singulisphaera acidiphila (strain ATCC BAA-1392 / DSM 18658 / VKM B-2454 / MOB10) GN=Sinac_2118 PE=4 SV=1 [Gemmata massiliana]|uniref:Uncharacterized protein n=1 Tax=Gemmata massiliana TaxID=1210884 RepID=A0A6P2D1L5_9BACT|nr:hypothetical protein [Gemmata massiliana]VTR95019.1 Uncharacterized protein OS=Singulisphaera acidiphila (strain ATCC BAA-1392 / DSM 18658 / VKM B-2454 / MOB10) GN=Sinac_2118 PE=4 SV=1 [Gemmata massiliana]
MNTLDRAEQYLAIPPQYGADLGGLWWSSRRDAIERRDGATLAVADEIRAVLDGALTPATVPAFAFVLNVLFLMKSNGGTRFESLHQAYAATRGVAARGRNVGLLIARLCRALPPVPGRITMEDISVALRSLRLYGPHTRTESAEEPPLTRVEFEQHLADQLTHFDRATLIHWLTHGCAPGAAGQQLTERAETLPGRVTQLLLLARKRARLVGAASLVSALDAALTLPPRGRPPNALPLGGYCDVTTRGDPERLLPGQFALDPDEFVRRFAASELLYFKREEPHEAVRPERIILLDQGVRTWGSVRFALAAAALALLRVDAKRSGPARLFTTSGAVDLLHPNPAVVADRLEASDLTPNPGDALERLLQAGEGEPRDIIVLTHPRNWREPNITSAAAKHAANDRLFAVTVDETGRAELSQWMPHGARALRSFRVDLVAAEAARSDSDTPRPKLGPSPSTVGWSGEVEPVPFPFRPGVVSEPQHFGFATHCSWLVAAGRDGVLHGFAFDGTPPEVLPRPYRSGVVLRHVDAVLGVTGGVVVCGRMAVLNVPTVSAPAPHAVTLHTSDSPVMASGASDDPLPEQLIAAHYDWATRHVTLHVLGPVSSGARWSAYPDLHSVTVRTSGGAGCALDLSTHSLFPQPNPSPSTIVSRARHAWDRVAKGAPPYELPILTKFPGEGVWDAPFVLHTNRGALTIQQPPTPWQTIAPLRDGKVFLTGAQFNRAQLAGDVLALSHSNATESNLLLLRGPDGAVLGEVQHPQGKPFALSADGMLLARCDGAHTVTITDTAAPAQPFATGTHAALHNGLQIELNAAPFELTITIGGYQHRLRIESGALHYVSRWEVLEQANPQKKPAYYSPANYDTVRFPIRESVLVDGWIAVVDRLGQVLLFRREGTLVAAFVVRRERVAAWVPGGVFWGDARLIGGPATPDAAEKIGRAISEAGGTSGDTVPVGPARDSGQRG